MVRQVWDKHGEKSIIARQVWDNNGEKSKLAKQVWAWCNAERIAYLKAHVGAQIDSGAKSLLQDTRRRSSTSCEESMWQGARHCKLRK